MADSTGADQWLTMPLDNSSAAATTGTLTTTTGTGTLTINGGYPHYAVQIDDQISNTIKIGEVELTEDDLKILKHLINRFRPKPKTPPKDEVDLEQAIKEAVGMLK
jgi:hypothetical protein